VGLYVPLLEVASQKLVAAQQLPVPETKVKPVSLPRGAFGHFATPRVVICNLSRVLIRPNPGFKSQGSALGREEAHSLGRMK